MKTNNLIRLAENKNKKATDISDVSNRSKTYLFDGVQGQRYHAEWQLHLREVRNGLRRKFRENLYKENNLNPQRLVAFTTNARDPVVLIGGVDPHVMKRMKINRKASTRYGESKVSCRKTQHNGPGQGWAESSAQTMRPPRPPRCKLRLSQSVFYLPYGSSVEVLDRLPENRKGLSKGKTGTLAGTGVISFL